VHVQDVAGSSISCCECTALLDMPNCALAVTEVDWATLPVLAAMLIIMPVAYYRAVG
jgi:hypothetical protein